MATMDIMHAGEDVVLEPRKALCGSVTTMLHPIFDMAKHKSDGVHLRFCFQEIPV